MIRRANFVGSIRELGSAQLQQLRNSALYRGMDATAKAIKREQVRRAQTEPPPYQTTTSCVTATAL